jgi:hypothetical protein
MIMSKKNRVLSLASLGKLEDQALPIGVTPEMVASMPIETVEEGLREMGLAPDQALPMAIRHIINDGKDKSLERLMIYKYTGNKFYKRLQSVAFNSDFLIPKCISTVNSLRKVIARILILPSRLQIHVYAILTIIMAISLFYINLINDNATKSYRDEHNRYQSVQKTQVSSHNKTLNDKFLSSEDI